jgi:hypothetical protein
MLTATRTTSNAPLLDLLRKLASKEYDLMDSCDASDRLLDGDSRALSHHVAGLGQVHVFDLDSALRDLGGTPISYLRYLAGTRRPRPTETLVTQLIEDYTRALRRHDLTAHVRSILEGCLEDYQSLRRSSWVRAHSPSLAATHAA